MLLTGFGIYIMTSSKGRGFEKMSLSFGKAKKVNGEE